MTPEESIAIARARARAAANMPHAGVDAAKAGGSGLLSGLTATADAVVNAMTPTNPLASAQDLYGTLTGSTPPAESVARAQEAIPSAAPFTSGVEQIAPGAQTYEPQTDLGKFARPVGEAASGLILGPGGVAKKAIMSVGAGVVSEAAGRTAKKHAPNWEPLARALGMVVGGVGTSAVGSRAGIGSDVVISAAKKVAASPTTPDPEQLKAVTKGLYDSLTNMGVNYDVYSWQGLGQRMNAVLSNARNQHFRSDAPIAYQKADEFTQEAMTKSPPSFMELERRSQVIGGLEREAAKAGNLTAAHALGIIRRELDDFAINTPMSTTLHAPAAVIEKVRGLARSLALKTIKNRRMNEILEDAGVHPKGLIEGLKMEITRALKNPADKRLFTENERALLKAVRDGSKPVNVMSRFGMPRMVMLPVGGIMSAGAIGTAMTLSPLTGTAIAAGGALAGGAAIARARLPAIASSRFDAAQKSMRNTAKEQGKGKDFDTEFGMQRLEKNRRRIRQLLLTPGVMAQEENENGQP